MPKKQVPKTEPQPPGAQVEHRHPAASPPPASPPQNNFPVVGIGASAGGLEAFTALLNHLPAHTGMAFVLVQHLDPKHESLLAGLLSRTTAMPLEQVRDGTAVQPNHVYVIPPNTDMVIAEGRLLLQPRAAGRGGHMPIDHFFRSLAADQKRCAIGVVLSGSSSDGALGTAAIKGEGGITFAQDEPTARYDAMPRAAVASGFVDFVLPPERIAEELARIGRHPCVTEREAPQPEIPEPQQPPDPLARIFALLRAATSVDFSLYKHSTIRRRINRRMALHRVENLAGYVEFLEQHPAEVESLYREMLIKVTGFFRDPELFQALQTRILPEILSRLAPDTTIRIWVPGCATGEEAYSIAIALLEFLAEKKLHWPIQIFATDVSEEAIEKARAGVYIENIAADVSPERLRRFFVKHDGGYQVSKPVRELCVFARQNLTRDPPFSKLDLISCRNVLIYLEAVLQKRVIPLFHYALKPDGFLVLGGSETIGAYGDLFALTDKKNKIYTRRQAVAPIGFDLASGRLAGARPERPPKPGEEQFSAADLQKEADRIVLARFAPAGVIIDGDFEVVQFRGRTSRFLEPAPGKASLNLLKMAHEGLLLELRSAVEAVKRTGETVRKKNVPAKVDHEFRDFNFEVVPLAATPRGRHYLILFEESRREPPAERGRDKRKPAAADRQVTQLKQELVATREYLQSIIEEHEATNEELQSANEEILSSNEELQSINEELETAKEELQSSNEELNTLNEELQNRNTELSRLNDDLTNLLGSVNIGIVMLGSDLRIRRFTPMAGKMLNLIPADLGRPITDIRPGVQIPELGRLIGEVIDTVSAREREVVDREGHWFSLVIRPYRTADNRIDGAVLTLVDIDTLKRLLEQAGEARDFAQAVVETVADPLLVLDRELRIAQANAAFFEAFQLRREDIEGKPLDRLPGAAASLGELARLAVVENGRIHNREIELDLSRGPRTLLASARAVSPGSSPDLLVLSLRDITQVKASEILYRKLFQESFASTTEGILLLDANSGEITDANILLSGLLGYRQEELVGRRLWDFPAFHPVAASGEEFFRRLGSLHFDELSLNTRSGSKLDVTVGSSIYQAGDRNVVQLNFRDLTRKFFEDQLRQSQKMEAIGRLAGGVAHDFNNLLTVIGGYSEQLASTLPPDSDEANQARDILEAAERAARLTRRLLIFSRRGVVETKVLDLNAILRDMEEMLHRLVGDDVHMEFELAPDPAAVRADQNQLEQVILNLVVNSREAMPQGGAIRIRTTQVELGPDYASTHPDMKPGRFVALEVADTGSGMDHETQQHIFEPFFTTKAPGKGTGLGLSTVYGVVKQAGGDVRVESEPGRGCTLTIYLPLTDQPAEPEPEPEELYSVRGSEMILLVEDEDRVRGLMRDVLGDLGYTVLEAVNGPAALNVIESADSRVDLLVTDVVMPEMNGRELARQIHEQRPELKVLFVSGYAADALDMQGAAAAGIFLQKPFSRAQLAHKIREILEKEG